MNLTFICKYIDGNENVSDESIEVGWFTPNIAKEKITVPDIKKRVCDSWNLMVSTILVLLKIKTVK